MARKCPAETSRSAKELASAPQKNRLEMRHTEAILLGVEYHKVAITTSGQNLVGHGWHADQ